MNAEDGQDPAALRWAWEQPVPLRWLLIDEYTTGRPDTAVAVCADVDGLFADAPPPPEERFTLLGCVPGGRLAAALRDAGAAWLGNVALYGIHHPDRAPAAGCDPVPVGCCACVEDLADVTVLGQRPSVTRPGTVDVDIEGRLLTRERYTSRSTAQAPDAAGYRLMTGVDDDLGGCDDVEGVFRDRPAPSVRPATLLGCRPAPPLAAAIEAVHRGDGKPGGAAHRRRVAALICAVDVEGRVTRTFSCLQGSVLGARPSAFGDGLLDITFDVGVGDPMPVGAREIWERWCTLGRPAVPGLWTGYDRALRHEWSGAALAHHRSGGADRPAGSTYHLDGRHVTDVDGFYCAIGEAVNGPGGYFGWNGDALDDCLNGGWGAATPFRLVWHDAEVARTHLTGYDRHWRAPAATLQDLLDRLAASRVEVELR